MFSQGERLTNIADLVLALDKDNWIWFRRKPMHKSFLISMQFRTVLSHLNNGWLSKAVKNNADKN